MKYLKSKNKLNLDEKFCIIFVSKIYISITSSLFKAPSNSSNFLKYRLLSISSIKVEKDLQATLKVLQSRF